MKPARRTPLEERQPPFVQEPDWPWCPEWIEFLHRHVPPDNDVSGIQRQEVCEVMPGGSGLRHAPLVDRAREDRQHYCGESAGRAMYSLRAPRRWVVDYTAVDWIESPIGRICIKTCAKTPSWEKGYIPLSSKQLAESHAGDIILLARVRGPWVSFMYWAYWEQFCWTQKKQDWDMNPDQMLHVPVQRARPIALLVAELAAKGWHLTPQQIDIPWPELL